MNPFREIELSSQAITTAGQNPSFIISVKDNGGGIPDEIKEKIFLPLFTTKDRDHGTGLGLAISKDIVDEMGGKIEFSSTPGQGQQFMSFCLKGNKNQQPFKRLPNHGKSTDH